MRLELCATSKRQASAAARFDDAGDGCEPLDDALVEVDHLRVGVVARFRNADAGDYDLVDPESFAGIQDFAKVVENQRSGAQQNRAECDLNRDQ